MNTQMPVSVEQYDDFLKALKARFEKNRHRHENLTWEDVCKRLTADEGKLRTLYEMEISGGEPDIVWGEQEPEEWVYYDCSPESPSGRRSLCYDQKALESRKTNKPRSSAMAAALDMGAEMLTEEQYRWLQNFGPFDVKTSSWVKTTEDVRALGGALFCDRRYNRIFTYHNGAESYYASRGFRTLLRI